MKCKKLNCNALALKNDSYCYMHSKKISNAERHKARSKGGKNKIIKVNDEFENFELNNFADVRKLNAVLINRVLQNELDLRIATGVCYNLNLQMKLIQFETLENRVSDIEKSLFDPEAAQQRIKELFIGK